VTESAAWGPWLSTAELTPVVTVLEASVAVRAQEPVEVMVRALKEATPATATADAVPPMVQPEVDVVIVTVSVEPVPVRSTLPRESSTETLNVVKAAD
jgi:hypothetical protein